MDRAGRRIRGFGRLRLHLHLMKMPLSLLISLSAVFGFVLKKDPTDALLLPTAVGVFILACGGATLNNFQDRHVDRMFSRTKDRPLPAGHLPPGRALMLATALIPSGLIALYFDGHSIKSPILGGIALLLYNGIYTPFKHRISLSLPAGICCGMIPPFIGWTASGGDMISIRIWMIMALFGFWQLPHFWLVLLRHLPDYQKSVLPNMLRWVTRRQLEKMVFIWIFNFAVLLFAVPVLYMRTDHFIGWIIACVAISLMIISVINILLPNATHHYHRLFTCLNGSIFLVMITVISDAFFGV